MLFDEQQIPSRGGKQFCEDLLHPLQLRVVHKHLNRRNCLVHKSESNIVNKHHLLLCLFGHY